MKYLSTKESSEIIGVAEQTVRAYLSAGKLKGERVGIGNRAVWMVDAASVRKFMEAGGRSKSGMPATKDPKPDALA